MTTIKTCTWAPTALAAPDLTGKAKDEESVWGGKLVHTGQSGPALQKRLLAPVQQAEALGIDYLLVAQRWWGTGQEIEGSSYDCLAMTDFYAAHTEKIHLITAIHPGFFLPAPIAKWSATLDCITNGRWSINVTSGWHEAEFGMYGAELIEHDDVTRARVSSSRSYAAHGRKKSFRLTGGSIKSMDCDLSHAQSTRLKSFKAANQRRP